MIFCLKEGSTVGGFFLPFCFLDILAGKIFVYLYITFNKGNN